jgi:hypothetical protein
MAPQHSRWRRRLVYLKCVTSCPFLSFAFLCYAMLCCNDYPPAHPHACACMYIYMYLAWLFRPRFVD